MRRVGETPRSQQYSVSTAQDHSSQTSGRALSRIDPRQKRRDAAQDLLRRAPIASRQNSAFLSKVRAGRMSHRVAPHVSQASSDLSSLSRQFLAVLIRSCARCLSTKCAAVNQPGQAKGGYRNRGSSPSASPSAYFQSQLALPARTEASDRRLPTACSSALCPAIADRGTNSASPSSLRSHVNDYDRAHLRVTLSHSNGKTSEKANG